MTKGRRKRDGEVSAATNRSTEAGEEEKASDDEGGRNERRRTRTYNALFLVAARFKGKRTLLDISIRGKHAASRKSQIERGREREEAKERQSERRAGGVAFPEGRSREKATGGCRDTRGGSDEEGGSNRVACNFEMDSAPPTTPSRSLSHSLPSPSCLSIHRVASSSSSSFLSSHETRGVDQPRSRRLLHVSERERETRGGRTRRKCEERTERR